MSGTADCTLHQPSRHIDPLFFECGTGEFRRIAANPVYRNSLEVPNGTRKIFCAEGETTQGLDELRREVDRILYEVENDLSRSFRKLASARVEY